MIFCSDESSLTDYIPKIFDVINQNKLCLLFGQMGSGKTSLVRALGKYLGCSKDIGSPSFSIINEYRYINAEGQADQFYHMDLYRLDRIEQALDIAIEEPLFSGHICIIEWPELIMPLIQNEQRVEIYIDFLENQKRNYTLITK